MKNIVKAGGVCEVPRAVVIWATGIKSSTGFEARIGAIELESGHNVRALL